MYRGKTYSKRIKIVEKDVFRTYLDFKGYIIIVIFLHPKHMFFYN